MAVVVKNATKGVIFSFCSDENFNCQWRLLNLETHYNEMPFNIKLLNNKGVDIVSSGNAFVSDIAFPKKLNKEVLTLEHYKIEDNFNSYIKKLKALIEAHQKCPLDKYSLTYYDWNHLKTMETIDYYDPNHWALTYKMRGFTDLYAKHFEDDQENIDSVTAYSLFLTLRAKHGEIDYDLYDSSFNTENLSESDNSETETESDEEEIDLQELKWDVHDDLNLQMYKATLDSIETEEEPWIDRYFEKCYSPNNSEGWHDGFLQLIQNDGNNDFSNSNKYLEKLPHYLANTLTPTGLKPQHITSFKNIDFNCIYIEHKSITPDEIQIVERKKLPNKSRVFDLYDKNSIQPYGTIIEISML